MTPIEQDKFIVWLKRYPRIGAENPAITEAAAISQTLQDAFIKLQREGIDVMGMFGGIRQAMSSMADENTNLAAGINKTQAQLQALNTGYIAQIDLVTKIYQRNNELSKTYGITAKAAQEYGYSIDLLSVGLGFSRENTEKYIGSLGGLTNGYIAAGDIGNDFNKSLINQQRYLTDIIGLSDSAAESIMEFNAGVANRDVASGAAVTTAQLEEQLILRQKEAKAIEQLTGLKGVQRTIDTEIAAAGAEISLQYSKNPRTLGLAVMKSKALGLSMSQMAATGDKLLNIEESVGNELEYQLLSGKRLVDDQGKSYTNMYRAATLSGDMNKQADIMKNILEGQGDVLETNVLARKKLAETLGIEESTMAKMVQKRKLLKSLGAEKLFDLTGDALETELKNMNVGTDTIAQLMKEDDIRPFDQQAAESLKILETKGIIANFPKSGDDGGKSAYMENYNKSITSLGQSMQKYTAAIVGQAADGKQKAQGFIEFAKALNQPIGALSILNNSISTTSGVVTAFAAAVPLGVGTVLSNITNAYTEALGKLLGTTGKLDNMTVNSGAVIVKGDDGADDAVMMHDGVVNFNPRDKFTRVNDGMTVAGTNVGGIDRFAAQMEKRDAKFEQTMSRLIAQMATQTKTALESANIKIVPDRTFSSNSLNKGRYV
jgi:hypothetical protein